VEKPFQNFTLDRTNPSVMKSFSLIAIALLATSTVFMSCKKKGCTDQSATNYDPKAEKDDGSCIYPKRMFVTTAKYNGNLKGKCSTAANGLDAADCLCQKAADSAALGGTWVAWLSDGNTDARDRVADVGPWFLVGGTDTIFADLADLGTEPSISINVDEFGNSTSGKAWTGTGLGGIAISCPTNDFCQGWTSQFNGNGGMAGNPAATDFKWTQDGCTNCDQELRLYCIEQ
jgi:hypothetical protein